MTKDMKSDCSTTRGKNDTILKDVQDGRQPDRWLAAGMMQYWASTPQVHRQARCVQFMALKEEAVLTLFLKWMDFTAA